MNLELLPARTLNVVGDSHAEVTFRGIVAHDRSTGETWRTETVYVESLAAHTFSEQGVVIPTILKQLVVQRILLAKRTADKDWNLRAHPIGGNRATLFICGDVDLRGQVLPQLAGREYKIPWRSEDQQPELVDLPLAPFDKVHDFARTLLTPYIQGLQQLHSIGLSETYVLSLPPPTVDDDEFERFNGYRISCAQRYRGAMLMNDVLQALCDDAKIPFVDLWDRAIVGERLDPTLYLDGTHLAQSFALIAIEAIATSASPRGSEPSLR